LRYIALLIPGVVLSVTGLVAFDRRDIRSA
jgi:hypothetical protein